jgi:uncharacterized membrane protein YoaK (UPF0700 family)
MTHAEPAMLIRQGTARDRRLDRHLAFTLAAVAGGLNAAAFHAVGFFSANMTGNVSSASNLLAMGQWGHGAGYLAVVLTFMGGAMISTLTIDAGLRRGVTTIYARVILAEAAMLVMLSAARMMLPADNGVLLLILGLSFLMGLQNAIVTHISEARVRTTHVSGMATDIGIEVARWIAIARGHADTAQNTEVRSRLQLHLGTVASFLAGGIAGVLIYRFLGDPGFAIAALPLAMVALPALMTRSR